MWTKYFTLINLVPGKVAIRKFGVIDFSSKNLPVQLCKQIYESGYANLKITDAGREELYGESIQKTVKKKVKTPKNSDITEE